MAQQCTPVAFTWPTHPTQGGVCFFLITPSSNSELFFGSWRFPAVVVHLELSDAQRTFMGESTFFHDLGGELEHCTLLEDVDLVDVHSSAPVYSPAVLTCPHPAD